MKKRVSNIQELYEFLQIHMVTKEEFEAEMKKMVTKEEFEAEMKKMVTKEEFKAEMKKMVTGKEFNKKFNKLTNQIDRFIVLHEKLETELVALRSQYNRLEERVKKIEARLATV
jgi:predicted  nucleic acid-binding Zn-ribbon protein